MPSRVVVSAHLDDAALSAFSLLDEQALVVTVLAALPPRGSLADWDALTGAADSRARVEERRAEDFGALRPTGARVEHLDFADEQYVEAGLLAAPTTAALAAVLAPLLDGAAPFAPAGIGNADHVVVRDAVLAVRPDATLYADLPYALREGFSLPAGVGDRHATDVSLDALALGRKLAAVRTYVTQVPQLVVDFGDFLDARGLGRERFWGAS